MDRLKTPDLLRLIPLVGVLLAILLLPSWAQSGGKRWHALGDTGGARFWLDTQTTKIIDRGHGVAWIKILNLKTLQQFKVKQLFDLDGERSCALASVLPNGQTIEEETRDWKSISPDTPLESVLRILKEQRDFENWARRQKPVPRSPSPSDPFSPR